MRKIPIFVSCPTKLNDQQSKMRKIIIDLLDEMQMESRALGREEYPKQFPLKEVYAVAKHCSGGIILGFEQILVTQATMKRGTKEARKLRKGEVLRIPTPWNHIEAGILFGLKLPILIFRENSIEGGVFDVGITDVFIHKMPEVKNGKEQRDQLKQLFLKWAADVHDHYYKE